MNATYRCDPCLNSCYAQLVSKLAGRKAVQKPPPCGPEQSGLLWKGRSSFARRLKGCIPLLMLLEQVTTNSSGFKYHLFSYGSGGPKAEIQVSESQCSFWRIERRTFPFLELLGALYSLASGPFLCIQSVSL